MTKYHLEYLLYLGIYIAALSGAYLAGYRMEIPYHYFQFLDRIQLQQNLGQSLLYLHSQPPLPNLFLGLALKFEGATGITPESTLLLLHVILGMVSVLCLAYLAFVLIPSSRMRIFLMTLCLLNPFFYSFLFLYFYTLHEIFFLSLLFVFTHRYLSQSHPRDFALVCAGLIGITYTRALFHFAWTFMVMLLLSLQAYKHRRQPAAATYISVLFLLTAILLLIWPLKNYLHFGFYGYSSWRGYNLSQQLPTSPPEIRTVFRDGDIPSPFSGIPVLSNTTKSGGADNWNYYPIISFSKEKEEEVFGLLKDQPELLWQKALRNYLRGHAVYSGRNPYEGTLDKRSTDTPVKYYWARLYELVVFQYFGNNLHTNYYSGFTFWFPVVMLAAGWKFFTTKSARVPEKGTMALILFTILWVLLMILLVDGAEGNRIRFSTEPFLILLIGWIFPVKKRPKSTTFYGLSEDDDIMFHMKH